MPLILWTLIQHLGISSVFNKNESSRPDSNPGRWIRRPTLNRCAIVAWLKNGVFFAYVYPILSLERFLGFAHQCTLEILLMIGYIKVNFGENMTIFSFILGSNGPN